MRVTINVSHSSSSTVVPIPRMRVNAYGTGEPSCMWVDPLACGVKQKEENRMGKWAIDSIPRSGVTREDPVLEDS